MMFDVLNANLLSWLKQSIAAVCYAFRKVSFVLLTFKTCLGQKTFTTFLLLLGTTSIFSTIIAANYILIFILLVSELAFL